jgi:dTDP-glucose pyrophosphorylase
MKILIPMAGFGSRFAEGGYTLPKPLIDVRGRPMIEVVVNNLNPKGDYIFIIQKTHSDEYDLDSKLKSIAPNCKIVKIDEITEGSACTSLLAETYINNDEDLLIANCDQYIQWNRGKFFEFCSDISLDGAILTFKSKDPNCSYVKTNKNDWVLECKEKQRISNVATVGVYYWNRGSDYVKYTKQMIRKNIRTNNEFYICPVYNEAIADNLCIKNFNIEDVWQIGTPDDLLYFSNNYFNNPDIDSDIWANTPT